MAIKWIKKWIKMIGTRGGWGEKGEDLAVGHIKFSGS